MEFDLTPEEIDWINAKVKSGEYQTPEDVISTAIHLLDAAETVQAIKEGMESFERGEGKPVREALNKIAGKHSIPS